MQQMEQPAGLGGAERKRVEAVVETLATLHNRGETLAEVAHDARNMVTALGLYCDLLEEPRPAAGWWKSWWLSTSARLREPVLPMKPRAAWEDCLGNPLAETGLSGPGLNVPGAGT